MTLGAMDGNIGESGLRKRGGYFFLRGVGVVAVITQVAENHIAQPVMRDAVN